MMKSHEQLNAADVRAYYLNEDLIHRNTFSKHTPGIAHGSRLVVFPCEEKTDDIHILNSLRSSDTCMCQ